MRLKKNGLKSQRMLMMKVELYSASMFLLLVFVLMCLLYNTHISNRALPKEV